MAFLASFEVSQEFKVNASMDEVHGFLCDVPGNLALHPNTSEVRHLEPEVYEVVLKKIGTDKYNFQPSYTCKYIVSDDGAGLRWDPINKQEALRVIGSFALLSADDGQGSTSVIMNVYSEMKLLLPSILRSSVSKFVASENHRASRLYAQNIIDYFGGGAIVSSISS